MKGRVQETKYNHLPGSQSWSIKNEDNWEETDQIKGKWVLLLIILASLTIIKFSLQWPKADGIRPTSPDTLLRYKLTLKRKDTKSIYHDIHLLLPPISFPDSLTIEGLNKEYNPFCSSRILSISFKNYDHPPPLWPPPSFCISVIIYWLSKKY